MNQTLSAPPPLIITRIFDAPRDLVFKVWTEPDHLVKWWGPHGFSAHGAESDLQPGGKFKICMVGHGMEFWVDGIYRDVDVPNGFSVESSAIGPDGNPLFTVLQTITFAEVGNKTELTLRAEAIALFDPMAVQALAGMEQGWNESLDKFGDYLGWLSLASAERKNKLVVSLPSDLEIKLERAFDAPAALVFEAWTNPAHVAQWWGCDGSEMLVCEADVRVGGAWRYTMQIGDHVMPMKGEYLEVDRPHRLVHTSIYDVEPYNAAVATVTVTFEEVEGRTLMTEVIRHTAKEFRDGHVQSGMEMGAGQSLNHLEDLLRTLV